MGKVRVAILGTGFSANLHAEGLAAAPNAEVVAVAGIQLDEAGEFARKHGIPAHYVDYLEVLDDPTIDVVNLCVPTYLHARIACEAASRGKHVICEKPLCLSMAEADAMIDACAKAGVKLMYAEMVCFAPKYVRAKQLVDEGSLGSVYAMRHCEKHSGPHSAWFWDVRLSGGGALMDMGCHGIELFRWVLGKPKAKSVYAEMGTFVHKNKTRGEDYSLAIVTFEDGTVCTAENSWLRLGGVEDRVEIYGSQGQTYADLLQGSSLQTYSEAGYGYAVEKAATTRGWTYTMFEEVWNYGFPQEMAHFIDCIANDKTPMETGEDGKAVLEIMFAAYESARTGQKVQLPFQTSAARPIDLYLGGCSETDLLPAGATICRRASPIARNI